MRILTVTTLIIWLQVTTADATTTEALSGNDNNDYWHRILRLDPRTVDYKDGSGGVARERVHVNSNSNNKKKNKNKKFIQNGIDNDETSLQTKQKQQQIPTMHPLDGRCQSTKLDETQKARLGCPPPPPPPPQQQQPTLKTVTISDAAQESDTENNTNNVKTKKNINSSLASTPNLRKKGPSLAATAQEENSQVNQNVVDNNNNDDDDTFQAQAADAEDLSSSVKTTTKLGGESAISRRCQSPTLSAALKKRLKCPETATTAEASSSSSTLEANSSAQQIKIQSDDSESTTSHTTTPETTMAPKEYMEALSFAVNGHGPEEHERDGDAVTIEDTTVASQNDTSNDDDDVASAETAAPTPVQEEQPLPVAPITTKPQTVISAASSQKDNVVVDNGTDDAPAVVVSTAAAPPQQQQQELKSAPIRKPPTTATAASASGTTSSTAATTTKSQNLRTNDQVPAESVSTAASTTTTTTNRPLSRRRFLSYVPSQWETMWINGIQEWENNFSICEQFLLPTSSTDDADNTKLLQQQRQQQSEYLSKYMNISCQERFPAPHEEWCYLHDGRHHVYYNTKSHTTTGTWEIYADQTPEVLQDVDLPNSVGGNRNVSPQKGDEDVFAKFVFLDETTGEVYEEYIEPLVSHLRFPLAQCVKNNNIKDQIRAEQLAWFSGYVMPPPSLSRFPRKFYIDVGGDRWQRLHYVARTWERQDGGAWDSIYSFANHVQDSTFFKKMPDSVRDKLERQDAVVTMEPTDKDGEQFLPDFIQKETKDDDYVLLKLDKGNPATKEGIVQYILDHVGEVHVDELIWQHNLEHNYLMKALFDTVEPQPLSDQSLSEAYAVFAQLRQKGIRAHAWI
ncbi:hypothetical protein MHU86_14640 [Fragilaria crotonensis]|nr:hypothetical protein MHU86_14640 [Fragilaria crotonensis]